MRYLVETLGYRGEKLARALRQGSTWRPLHGGRYGSAAIEPLITIVGFMAVGMVTHAAIQAAYKHYEAEMNAIGNAADREAYNNVMRLLLDRVTTGRHRLCNNMSFAEAARRVRINQEHARKPYLGVIEKCDEGPGRFTGPGGLFRNPPPPIEGEFPPVNPPPRVFTPGLPPPGYSDCGCASSDGRNNACKNNGCVEPPNYAMTCFWECTDAGGNRVKIRGRDGAIIK